MTFANLGVEASLKKKCSGWDGKKLWRTAEILPAGELFWLKKHDFSYTESGQQQISLFLDTFVFSSIKSLELGIVSVDFCTWKHQLGEVLIMTKFRPCIDLHSGQVKQIVGGTLTTASSDLKTNYVSKLPAGHFAKLYKENGLTGAHVIMLGPGNEEAAKAAVGEWKNGLQVGGGVTDENAKQWIEWGAERVCFYCVAGG